MANTISDARPKRAGEDFARSHNGSTKKPRFDPRNPSTLAADEPEDDIILDADVIGKSGAQLKRNAINIDGYESDSDNDNFDARAAVRDKKSSANKDGPSKDEEDDDMFADLEEPDGDEDEDLAREGKKSKKDVRFLDQSEIEGQVMSSKSGGHVPSTILLNAKDKRKDREGSVDSSSSSGGDEERDMLPDEMEGDLAAEIGAGGKKKHAPKLDAFNLKGEEEEGRYDESGNYVRKAMDPDAVNDNWLDGLSKKDMRRAREAQSKRNDETKRRAATDDATLTSDVLSTLITHLETGETPLEGLQRLNRNKPKETKVAKWKQKKQKDKMDMDQSGEDPMAETAKRAEIARKTIVEAITGAADKLYSRGQHEIYDTERELLMRHFKRETGEDWKPAEAFSTADDAVVSANAQWEYRWNDARDGGEHHGPYDGATMEAWKNAGYFGDGVEFRRVGGSDWSRVLDVD